MDLFATPIFGYLLRAGVARPAAEDLFQESFLRVHRSAARYDPKRSFRVWLFTIVSNLLRSHWRKQKVRRIFTSFWRRAPGDAHDEPVARDPEDPAVDVETRLADRQRLAHLEQALGQLAEGPRQALILTRLEGFSQEEAAQALDVPLPTLKTWIRRSRLKLAAALEPASSAGDAADEGGRS